MHYKTLTVNETNIWINNLEKVIKLNELLVTKSKERHLTMIEEYNKKYLSTFLGKILNSSECVLMCGRIYESYDSWFPLKKMTQYTVYELNLEDHTDEYFYHKMDELKMTLERWSKYASRPFQIDEKDVIYYQNLALFHKETIEVAKGIGIEYEAFNMDEYC